VWTTELFSPTQMFTGGQILVQQVVQFKEAHADAALEFVVKKPYGKGGILDYLLATQSVVPDLLPDLVLIDVDELGTAVQAGLLQPLDDWVPTELKEDLYPAIRQSNSYDGRLYGLQVFADLEHLVYNTGKLTVSPRSWPGVLSNPGPYIFPAGGEAGLANDAFWIQYLAVAPAPSNASERQSTLDEEGLISVFQYYQEGLTRGIFPSAIQSYHGVDDCWKQYQAGAAVLSHVNSHLYLRDRQSIASTSAALIPGSSGPAASINQGWTLALVADDPVRQALASDFALRMMAPDVNAAWNRSARYLPTRQTALAEWDPLDTYTSLARQLLETAQPRLRLANSTQVSAAVQEAIENVLTRSLTPEEAAAWVIQEID
jgi:ABC-type glycerol-3-phosphate transport system substrate-binding protein